MLQCFQPLVRRLGSANCACLTQVAMAVMVYALYTYHWRAASIRRGGRGPYDDRFGPVSIFIVIGYIGID